MECAICFENVNNGSSCRGLSCGHKYHETCIGRWLQSAHTCPMCRAPVVEAEPPMSLIISRFNRLLREFVGAMDEGEREYKQIMLYNLIRKNHLEYDNRIVHAMQSHNIPMP